MATDDVSRMRLKIADCEIPEQFLLFVVISIGPLPISFGAAVWGKEGQEIQRKLKLLAEQKALPYDATDKQGLSSAGLCEIKDLKFENTNTEPAMIKFSGKLAHPFL